MKPNASKGKIVKGFTSWIQAAPRAGSKTIEFGNWWRMDATYWRVSWLEATNELYAVERQSDRFILLSQVEKKEVHELMKKWYDGDNLHALLQRFVPASV